jgi:dUTP pyrophosphatase
MGFSIEQEKGCVRCPIPYITYMINCKIKCLSTTAKVPTYGDPQAIGADLYSDQEISIGAGQRALVGTGIAIEASDNYKYPGYFRVAPRSGLGVRGIDIGAGVVDISYRGEIKVVVINHREEPFVVYRGDRIAQLIFEHASQIHFVEALELSMTKRGEAGFGSTG